MLVDKYHREVRYLRIGVTDRCNLRCRYCMPAGGIDFLSRKDILNYDEILCMASIFKELGVTKVRLTGGEPFVRQDVDYLIKELSMMFSDLHITTNASLLHKFGKVINKDVFQSLNISLDSLDRTRFHMITRRDDFVQVKQNINAAIDNGLSIKINMVVMRGVNDNEILDFIHFGQDKSIPVRFIEAMPFNSDDGNKSLFMDYQQILDVISKQHSVLPFKSSQPSSSLTYRLQDGYEFGIIPAYTRSLCGSCDRIRLTARGEILTCLYADQGLNVKELLRDPNVSKDEIVTRIRHAVWNKAKSGIEEQSMKSGQVLRSMTTIGG